MTGYLDNFLKNSIELFLNYLYICVTKIKIMIHTVKIDDSIPSGKRIIKDLRRFRKAVKFENTIAKIWQNVKTPKLLEEKSIKLREELLRRLQQIK